MPGSRDIRNKIKSVQNTRKITKAMEMVAASKMRRAQDRIRSSGTRSWSSAIRSIAWGSSWLPPTKASAGV
jgi:F-type H+-transporting ATPase subunit gamma